MTTNLESRVRQEVETLHAFISGWIRGELAQSDAVFERDFASRFGPEFENIQPAGHSLSRDALIASIRSGYGMNQAFRISISDCRIRAVLGGGSHVVATYVETQEGAKNSNPPMNIRVSTVLLEMLGRSLPEGNSGGAAGSPDLSKMPLWNHLHETARKA